MSYGPSQVSVGLMLVVVAALIATFTMVVLKFCGVLVLSWWACAIPAAIALVLIISCVLVLALFG